MAKRRKQIGETLDDEVLLFVALVYWDFVNENGGLDAYQRLGSTRAMANKHVIMSAWLQSKANEYRDTIDNLGATLGYATADEVLDMLDELTEREVIDLFEYASKCAFQLKVKRPRMSGK